MTIRECDVRTGAVTERAPTAAEQAYIDAVSAEWIAGAAARATQRAVLVDAWQTLRAQYGNPRTVAQVNTAIDAISVILRAIAREELS